MCVGAHNVGLEYLSGHSRLGPWRDTHVQVAGTVVQAIQYCFLEDWYLATVGVPDLNWHLQEAAQGTEETLLIAIRPG